MAVDDTTLAARVASGDVAAFRELYARHARDVYVLAAHLAGPSAAEEIVQDVFMAVWRKADQFDGSRGSFGGWLMGIARHRTLDEMARRRRAPDLAALDELLATAEPGPEEQALADERRDRVRRALAALPAEQRKALVLGYFGGLSQREIARTLGWPLGTVKKRVRLGLEKLRASLAGETGVEEGEKITR